MIIVFNYFFLTVFLLFQNQNNISFHLESRTLANQKVVVIKADIYFKIDENKMITHYVYPIEYITITNNKGEAHIYDPKKNAVLIKRGLFYSTENDNINLFLRGRYSDLGLKDMNYKMISSKHDQGYIVTEWIPQKKTSEESNDKIQLAHDNDLPIYMAIYSNDKLIRKIYYSGYAPYGNYYLPNRITEISYVKTTQ